MAATPKDTPDTPAPAVIELAGRIEHTALKPDLRFEQVEQLCAEAVEYGFAGVCVPPFFVDYAVGLLEGKPPRVVTVVGFPLGYCTTRAKVEEARKAIEQGADEIDMVANIAAIKNDRWSVVRDDVESLTTLCRLQDRPLKLIVETGLLEPEEIARICEIALETGVDYVKTSTGFNGPGASVEAVRTLVEHLGGKAKVKASGGIRTREFALELAEAGADRIGTSSGPALVGHAD